MIGGLPETCVTEMELNKRKCPHVLDSLAVEAMKVVKSADKMTITGLGMVRMLGKPVMRAIAIWMDLCGCSDVDMRPCARAALCKEWCFGCVAARCSQCGGLRWLWWMIPTRAS